MNILMNYKYVNVKNFLFIYMYVYSSIITKLSCEDYKFLQVKIVHMV